MKLVYLPLLAVNNIGFLQHLLFGLAPVYVSVKILYFHQVLKQKNTKQKSYAKSCVKLCKFSVRSNADKAKVDDSWENCVLHQWFKKC